MDAISQFEWPVPTTAAVVYILLGFIALLTLAVCVEIGRQSARARRRLEAQWRAVESIMTERELGEEENRVLKAFLERQAGKDPLRAVTVRHHFDRCIHAEMVELSEGHASHRFDEEGVVLRDIRERLGLDYIPFGRAIQSTRELYVGQLLWAGNDTTEEANWCRLRVVGVDEAYIFTTLADEEGPRPDFKKGQRVRCRMWREEDARYMFNTHFARRETSPRAWLFTHSVNMSRMQSRAHFRVPHDQATTVGILNAPVDGDVSDVKEREVISSVRGRITSVSAGGFAMVAQQTIPRQVLLRLELDLQESPPFEVEARMVASTSISGGRSLVRGSFINLGEEELECIARHVTLRQQHMGTAEPNGKQ